MLEIKITTNLFSYFILFFIVKKKKLIKSLLITQKYVTVFLWTDHSLFPHSYWSL